MYTYMPSIIIIIMIRGLKACMCPTNILPPVSISEYHTCFPCVRGYHAHWLGKKPLDSKEHFTTCLLFQTGVYLFQTQRLYTQAF